MRTWKHRRTASPTRRLIGLGLVVWCLTAGIVGNSSAKASDAIGWADRDYGHIPLRHITYPVEGGTLNDFTDDWGDPRSEGWLHQGQDLFAKKMTKILAAEDGVVAWVRDDGDAHTSGNAIIITAADGWKTAYMHINNDTPGTNDNSNKPEFRFAPGLQVGSVVKAGQFIAYVGNSGDAETTDSHLHFEIRKPDNTAIDPYPTLRLAFGQNVGSRCAFDPAPVRTPSTSSASGYYQAGADGGVFTFGSAKFYGSAGNLSLAAPVNGMAVTKTAKGYWLVASDGGVFTFGDAKFFGSTGNLTLNAPVIGMVPTDTGKGYWLVASDGGVFTFGDAKFFGSAGATKLDSPVVSLAPAPGNKGYWLVQANGNVIEFGAAGKYGDLTTVTPKAPKKIEPIVAMTSTPSGAGYWLLGDAGTVYAFGDAKDFGSLSPELSGLCWPRKAARIRSSATGNGYWITTADGALWPYGDAIDYGDMRGILRINRLNAPMVDQAVIG